MIELTQNNKETLPVKLFYAVRESLIFNPESGETGGTYKLSIRARLDPNSSSMCDASGTESGGRITFELNTFTQEFKRVCDNISASDAAAGNSRVWLEIYDTQNSKVLLQRPIEVVCRAATLDGQPPAAVENYLVKPAGGSTGQILKKTNTGSEWADNVAPQIQSDWEQSDNTLKDFIRNKPTELADFSEDSAHRLTTDAEKSVWNAKITEPSGKSANKYLGTDASNNLVWKEVNVHPGQPVSTVTASSGAVAVTPVADSIYKYTAASGDVVSVITSALTASAAVTFELWVTQPSTAVSFTLPSNVTWGDGESFSSQYSAPDISTASTLYCIVFRWNGTRLLGNLAYKESL